MQWHAMKGQARENKHTCNAMKLVLFSKEFWDKMSESE